MRENQWDQVLSELDDQTLEANKNWKLYWNAAWTNYKIKEFDIATKYFKTAVDLTNNPKDTSICLTFLGMSELENENYQHAIKYLNKSLQTKDRSLTRKVLAIAHMQLNNIEDAEQIHLDGIDLEPNNKERLAAYGDFLIDIGRNKDAEEIKCSIRKLE